MKALYLLAFFTICFYSCKEDKQIVKEVEEIKKVRNQENIINWKEDWVVGEGSLENYKSFGEEHESRRILDIDANGKKSILWECAPDIKTDWDGGFMLSPFDVDKSSSYMFVAWVRKVKGNSGKIYYAINAVDEVTGESVKNANFIGAGSTLNELDTWYTLVGYIYPKDHIDDVESDIISGLYLDGDKVQEGRDFKWSNNSEKTSIRVVQVKCDNAEERLLIWNPQLYKVDGTEPALDDLL